MYNQLDVYKKLRRSFKITQSFVDNAPTDTNQYEMRTIKQAGFDIKPTTQKLIGIELLKSHSGHDKYDNTLRQRLAPIWVL